MDKSMIIAKLREHEAELRAAGVEHLVLHGSYARGTAIPELSDVDLIAEFDGGREYSILDRVRLENRLSDLLDVKVDLSPARMLKEGVRERAAREAVVAF
jgi:predicted nucleotidyltransferase